MSLLRIAAAAVLLASTACESPVSERIIGVDADGFVRIFLFVDTNVDGTYNPAVDTQVDSVILFLRAKGAVTDSPTLRTDSAGFAGIAAPAGRYRAIIPAAVLGDTLFVINGGDEFTVAARDTIQQNVRLGFGIISPTQARTYAQGRTVWLTGIALNPPASFGDSTVHVSDTINAIRAIGIRPSPVFIGDSVLFFGRRTSRDGQPAFDVDAFLVRGQFDPPLPDSLNTARAANADGGKRDARLVKVSNALISDSATTANGSRLLRVDDGSGRLDVILSENLNWSPINQYAPGARFDFTGLLVPDPGDFSRWQLKPRARSDIIVSQ
ncbi:MAG: hypothetical protein ACREL7_11300 [Longimicrobiales bacterium]